MTRTSYNRRHRLVSASALVLLAMGAGAAVAATPAGEPQPFAIQRSTLKDSLMAFAEQAKVQLIMNDADLAGFTSNGLQGQYGPAEAVRQLLEKTPLRAEWINRNTIAIRPARAQLRRTSTVAEASAPEAAVEAPAGNGLEEILVTARRRSESLANVPATVSAINAEALIKQGIRTDGDLQAAVPGLIIRVAGSTNFINYVIRGASLDQYSGSVPGVQPYVNEVPFASNTAQSFFDLEGIQVLKGPQGTLFGRNLTGGAVLYQTAQPKPDLGGYASVQYGNYKKLVAEAAINVPLGDKAAIRIAGTHTSGGAFVLNLYDNQKRGDQKVDSGRISLKLEPSEALTNTTVGEYTRSRGTNQPLFPYYVLPCGTQGGNNACNFNPAVPAFNTLINSPSGTYYPGYPGGYVYPGGLVALPAFLRSKGRYVVDSNGTFLHRSDYGYLINTTSYEASSNLTIKNIFGYSKSDAEDGFDNDASPYPMIDPGIGLPGNTEAYRAKVTQFSNELQLQGKALDNRLTYIVGAFYVNTKSNLDSAVRQVYIIPPTTLFPVGFRFHGIAKDVSYAAFTQATYAVTDKLNLTAGGRWSWDKLTTYQLPDSLFFPGSFTQTAWQNNPSWTFSADYHATPQLMFYATTRGSWRVGGYNLFAPPVGNKLTAENGGNYFLPEKVRDVELGAKFNGRVGDVPLQVNVDAYQQWMRNVQKTGLGIINGTSASATVTVPSAQVSGIEGDIQLRPAEWLRFGGTFAYTHARFKNNIGVLYGIPAAFGPYGDSPRYSGSLFAEATAPLGGEAGTLVYHVDGFAQSSFYFSNRARTFDPGTRISGYALLNMRLDWQNPVGIEGLTISGFVKNVTNKLYYTGGAPGAQVVGLVSSSYGPPRTYGLIVRVSM